MCVHHAIFMALPTTGRYPIKLCPIREWSTSSAKQALAPKLLEVVEHTSHMAPGLFSVLIGCPVEDASVSKTTVMMGRFVPEVFRMLASVRSGRCYVCLQLRMESVCI